MITKEILTALKDKNRDEFLIGLMHMVTWKEQPSNRMLAQEDANEEENKGNRSSRPHSLTKDWWIQNGY